MDLGLGQSSGTGLGCFGLVEGLVLGSDPRSLRAGMLTCLGVHVNPDVVWFGDAPSSAFLLTSFAS